jgi:hypothetical protein
MVRRYHRREENLPVARIVRPMRKAADGLPLVGTRSNCLGVGPTGEYADVDLDPAGDENGDVLSNDKGLSVSADWRTLQAHQIPNQLDDGHNGACGKNMAVYVHGGSTGPFAEGAVAPGLEMIFKQGSGSTGVIRPVVRVPLSQYQADLQATRPNWAIDES